MPRFAALILTVAVSIPATALAWGGSGHRIVGQAAMQSLPSDLPAFLRTPKAVADVGELSREPDRWKGYGKLHDAMHEPAHFIDLSDDGSILGGPRLAALPPSLAEYDGALRAAGSDAWKAGWLPYSIVDQAQNLAKDFATWRVLNAALKVDKNKAHRAWMIADRARRESLILFTIGQLSHYVGDGSQPLHVSVHYNGWGDGPNPNGFTSAHIHSAFEGELVKAHVREPAVKAAMAAPAAQQGPLEARVAAYLETTGAQVEPLYALEKAGGLKDGDSRGVDFAVIRLAAGASELRDLIMDAWKVSPGVTVGWSPVSLADVEAGKADGYKALYNKD